MKKKILSVLVCGAVAFATQGIAATTTIKTHTPSWQNTKPVTTTTASSVNSTEFSGAFVGANVGFDVASLKYQTTDHGKSTPNKNTTDLGSQGPAGAVFAGYALNNNNWHYGAELTATYRDITKKNLTKDTDGNTLQQGSIQYYYGMDMELGRVMNNNTLFYVHGGPIYGNYKLVQNVTPSAATADNKTFHNSQFGGEIGLGLNYGINNHLAVQAEYSYDFYKAFKFTPVTNGATESFSPRVNNFNLGISYWFA